MNKFNVGDRVIDLDTKEIGTIKEPGRVGLGGAVFYHVHFDGFNAADGTPLWECLSEDEMAPDLH